MESPPSHEQPAHEGLHLAPNSWDGLQIHQPGLQVAELHTPLKTEYPAHGYYEGQEPPKQQRRKIWGLNPSTFWLSLVIAILLICVAIAGGVGGSLAAKNKTNDVTPSAAAQSSPSPSPSSSSAKLPTHSTSTTSLVTAPTSAAASCGPQNDTMRTITNGDSYRQFCDTDLYLGKNYSLGKLLDTINVISFEACLNACSYWNAIGVDGGTCVAVTWANVGNAFSSCWLKNVTGIPQGPTSGRQSAMLSTK